VWTLTFTHRILTYKTVSLTEVKVKQGVLPEGGRMIAVKRLAENAPVPAGITFETEVTNLMALKHENIVELVHYCHESQKKVVQHNGRYVIVDVIESCLCYKYLPKLSLDKYVYGMQCTIQHTSPLSTIHAYLKDKNKCQKSYYDSCFRYLFCCHQCKQFRLLDNTILGYL